MEITGTVCGKRISGDCVNNQVDKVTGILATIEDLNKQLEGLFNKQVANAIIERLGETKIKLGSATEKKENVINDNTKDSVCKKTQPQNTLVNCCNKLVGHDNRKAEKTKSSEPQKEKIKDFLDWSNEVTKVRKPEKEVKKTRCPKKEKYNVVNVPLVDMLESLFGQGKRR